METENAEKRVAKKRVAMKRFANNAEVAKHLAFTWILCV
jgi:hypothetical protein